MPLVIILLVVLAFGLGAWRGAPYVPILRRPAEELLDLAELKPGQTLIDLGSGDGRLLKLAAQRGIRGIGYEINPWLWLISRANCWGYRDKIELHLADYWHVRLPPADAIAVFLIKRYMQRLDAKLSAELIQPTTLVSYVFALPERKPEKTTKNCFRYRYQNGKND
jgi:16S rRNA A1518/A1519 N6-dimethyltransferase RsmA/KsgA/DIM1 with predicted DNA glycosylase/AP lyase activity